MNGEEVWKVGQGPRPAANADKNWLQKRKEQALSLQGRVRKVSKTYVGQGLAPAADADEIWLQKQKDVKD